MHELLAAGCNAAREKRSDGTGYPAAAPQDDFWGREVRAKVWGRADWPRRGNLTFALHFEEGRHDRCFITLSTLANNYRSLQKPYTTATIQYDILKFMATIH